MQHESDTSTQMINDSSIPISSADDNQTINKMATIIHIIFAILGITFNSITILIILKGQRFSKKIKIQLTNLAVADLLSSLFVFTGNSDKRYVNIAFPNEIVLCRVVKYVGSVTYYASLLCHVAIALERFVAVHYPFRMRYYTKAKVIAVNVLIWVIAAAAQLDHVFMANLEPHPSKLNKYVCYINFFSQLTKQLSIFLGLKLFLPSFTICIAYGFIAAKLRRRKKIRNSNQSYYKGMSTKVMSMLAVNGILTVLIWIPYYAFMSVFQSGVPINNVYLIAEILFYLILANCFVTPIIYFIFSQAFRTDLAEILCLRKKRPVTAARFAHLVNSKSSTIGSVKSTISTIDEPSNKTHDSSSIGMLGKAATITMSDISCSVI